MLWSSNLRDWIKRSWSLTPPSKICRQFSNDTGTFTRTKKADDDYSRGSLRQINEHVWILTCTPVYHSTFSCLAQLHDISNLAWHANTFYKINRSMIFFYSCTVSVGVLPWKILYSCIVPVKLLPWKILYSCIVPVRLLPWKIRVALPGKSKPRQSRATRYQPTVHAGCLSVSIIHQTLTRTTESVMCPHMLIHSITHGGVRTP